jgi:hypothetical protein
VKDQGKTVRLNVGIWFNEVSGHVNIAAKNEFISTVSANPESKRFHPNLYWKLAAALRKADSPHPNPSPEGEGLKE